MALTPQEWQRVIALREKYGAPGRPERWSITTGVYDERDRRRNFALKIGGKYLGGLCDPLFFDDLSSVEDFLSTPLSPALRESFKKQERKPATVVTKPVHRRRKRA